jgi:hypothetical protein
MAKELRLLHVVANGSAGAKNARLPAGQNNTYALFKLGSNDVELWIRELRLNAQAGLEAFHGMLPTPPLRTSLQGKKGVDNRLGRSSE